MKLSFAAATAAVMSSEQVSLCRHGHGNKEIAQDVDGEHRQANSLNRLKDQARKGDFENGKQGCRSKAQARASEGFVCAWGHCCELH